jgi:5-methylcytosine-specific restriction endonuclease McrA
MEIRCKLCGVRVLQGGNRQIYCRSCAKKRQDEVKRRYGKSDAGQAANRRATAKWLSSERGSAYMSGWEARGDVRDRRAAKHREKWASDPEYRARHKEWFREYYATPEGRAYRIAAVARRRGVPVVNYKRIALAIAKEEAACYVCGGMAQEVDHVLPISMARFLGILDCADDYVAPICFRCHVCKTKEDIRDVRRMRRLLK